MANITAKGAVFHPKHFRRGTTFRRQQDGHAPLPDTAVLGEQGDNSHLGISWYGCSPQHCLGSEAFKFKFTGFCWLLVTVNPHEERKALFSEGCNMSRSEWKTLTFQHLRRWTGRRGNV